MPVVDRNGHLGGVARFVDDNDCLPSVGRRNHKASMLVKCDIGSVYRDGI